MEDLLKKIQELLQACQAKFTALTARENKLNQKDTDQAELQERLILKEKELEGRERKVAGAEQIEALAQQNAKDKDRIINDREALDKERKEFDEERRAARAKLIDEEARLKNVEESLKKRTKEIDDEVLARVKDVLGKTNQAAELLQKVTQ